MQGLTISEIARRIQRSGLRDLRTSKTPEASVAGALSRDVIFARVAPATYALQAILTYHGVGGEGARAGTPAAAPPAQHTPQAAVKAENGGSAEVLHPLVCIVRSCPNGGCCVAHRGRQPTHTYTGMYV